MRPKLRAEPHLTDGRRAGPAGVRAFDDVDAEQIGRSDDDGVRLRLDVDDVPLRVVVARHLEPEPAKLTDGVRVRALVPADDLTVGVDEAADS